MRVDAWVEEPGVTGRLANEVVLVTAARQFGLFAQGAI